MHRSPLSWLVVFALLVAGFGATVLALNNDIYSANGFVRSYLQALERKDADEALGFAGMVVPGVEASTLLVDDALGEIGDIRLLSDAAVPGSEGEEHVVRFAYVIDGAEEITEFRVERAGSTVGLFSRWRFSVSPLARIDVAVAGDSQFAANGVAAPSGSPLLVLAPGAYEIDRDTELLSTSGVTISVTAIGDTEAVEIFPQPTEQFGEAAEAAVAAFLDECTAQQVLKPAGCPFGFTEANRIDGAPVWTVEAYPELSLSPADTSATWRASGAGGVLNLTMTVRSLFDGSTRRVDDDQDVGGSYLLALGAGDQVIVLEATALP